MLNNTIDVFRLDVLLGVICTLLDKLLKLDDSIVLVRVSDVEGLDKTLDLVFLEQVDLVLVLANQHHVGFDVISIVTKQASEFVDLLFQCGLLVLQDFKMV